MHFIIAAFYVLGVTIGIFLKNGVVESNPGVTQITGGEFPIGVDDPKIQNYTSHVMEQVNQHDRAKADNALRQLVEVVNATQQLVAGWLYKLTVLVGKTSCKLSESPANKCKLVDSAPRELYSAAILHAPWADYDGKITIEFLGVQ
ncbi:cystatin domain-containing protein [Ditylenchus destructor]|uniref:Cystatin domain-containing protein n=1 Tax=Ditylenchus destructor TaxID=166010 RepID=A0AAD4R471_9BILA|nr:cystatin domain-containing protein [Ditylenchus destructor]